MEKQRNLILAVALMGLLLIGWDYGIAYFYPHPKNAPVAWNIITVPKNDPRCSGGARSMA